MKISDLLTIVIPCKNEEKYIGRTLSNINDQLNIENTIVYVADSNSTDNTLGIIDEFNSKLENKLNIMVIPGGGVSIGRNNGLRFVETPFVLFMDADTTLENVNMIADYLTYMIDNDIYLMTSKLYCNVKDWRAEYMFKLFNDINRLLSYVHPFAVGVFFLTKVSEVRRLGGFDETVIHSEDYLLSKKYDKHKFKIGKFKVGQDNRRFKKFGYFKMIKLLINGLLNKNNIEYFRKNNNYW